MITVTQQLQCYHKWLETKENLSTNVVSQYGNKQNGFVEVAAFCHMTCRYYDRFYYKELIEIGAACVFYLAPGLICEEYWQVNSQKSIFRIADPTIQPFTTWQQWAFAKQYYFVNIRKQFVIEKEFSLSPHIANATSYVEMFDG